ncbi:MAG: carbon-nitrogen hydrolase family protein [Kangiellaceae bacterium]|jgi:nitrilase|nr:carbon-nitrogen hydrolase family protein [Kangiellaceae bacterium]
MSNFLNVALAQIEPVWLNRTKTIEKMLLYIEQAAGQHAHLVVFGEGLLPGYPFWLSITNGATFEDHWQKQMYAWYQQQAVDISAGDLGPITEACREYGIAAYVGCIEKTSMQRGKSVFCSLVYIDTTGVIESVHRKLMPTFEERLVWAQGDGNGLVTHNNNGFSVGGLNCWENWMPMARQSLYAQGEEVHIAVWPGGLHNTQDITPFIAKESRSYVVSVSGLMSLNALTADMPFYDALKPAFEQALNESESDYLANGGSCVVAPNGQWLLEPIVDREALSVISLDKELILQERQNFDPAGHYARPDVLSLTINNQRQSTINIVEQ